jgi:tetratricopeptide (TPR) repeat protein
MEFNSARELIRQAIDRLSDRNDKDSVALRMRHLLMLSTIERQDGNPDIALEIIDKVLTNPETDVTFSTGLAARESLALTLSQLHDDRAELAYLTALKFAGKKLGPEDPDRAFFEARYYSLHGDLENAQKKLDAAINWGFRDAIMLTDPDFESLRDDPRYISAASIVAKSLKPAG